MKYEITVGEVKAQNSSVRGYASVVFGDSFKVSNITILAGKDNRLYISMPHYRSKNPEEERKDICYPTTKEFRGELEANILLALENLQQTGQKKYLVGDEQDMELPFTVAVTPFEKENRSIKGLARIYLNDCFAVGNISLIEGKNGMFVSMPSHKTKRIDENNREVYRDICYPVTSEFREKVNNLLMDAYEKAAVEVQENVLEQAEGLIPAQDFPDMDLPTR
ncbi:MAG: SpoVG family protein [Lachnospiraceae bacterium]|nr:SpoVG family protein [Lachnospiraceae bacterium]